MSATTPDGAPRRAEISLPMHWSTPRLSQVAQLRSGADYTAVEALDGEVPVIGSGGPFAFASRKLFDGKAVLLGRKGTIDRPLYWDGPFWTVDTMFYAVPFPDTSARFLYYYCTTVDFARYSTNTALPSMSARELKALRVPKPPLNEQRQIAAYLDRETGQIDELIAKQEQLLTTLAERRQALIIRSFQRRPHWVPTCLKRLVVDRYSGASVNAVDQPADPGEPGVLKTSSVSAGRFVPEANKAVVDQREQARLTGEVRPGTIIVNRANSPIYVGTAALISDPVPANLYLSDKLWSIRFSADHRFVAWWLQTPLYRDQVAFTTVGTSSSMQNLSYQDFGGFTVALPPLREQEEIASALDVASSAMDRLSWKATAMIALLRERRQALISAAVTGKIDVRGK